MCPGSKKLVILGIPWDVDSEGLRQYMSQFGELADVMVMKDRASGRSRGFGYVTFASSEDAEKALAAQHTFKGRTLEVKVATPREEMVPTSKKTTRIFVARIPLSVTDEDFHSYFMKYGPVIDAYMPKEPVSKQHRGIGFVTYENSDSVDKLMSETHEVGGSKVAVDRATPKEDSRAYRVSSNFVKMPRMHTISHSSGYSNIDNYSRIAGIEPQANKLLSSAVCSAQEVGSVGCAVATGDAGSGNGQAVLAAPARVEKKMFIGRVPVEATTEDLHAYFSQFGWVLDVYLPKDAKKASHRGFGFVTFADEASAARVARLRHYLFGREIAVESASPTDRMHGGGQIPPNAFLSPGVERDLPSEVPGVATENCNLATSSTTSTGKWGKKLFIGRIPIEATAVDLRVHFSQFGHVMDVYLPKDGTKTSHRGFGFITFADEISAEFASQKIHKILGQKIVLDRAAPLENEGSNAVPSSSVTSVTPSDGSIPTLQNLSSQQAYDAKVVHSRGATVNRPLRSVSRYRPY
ncbi:uncharacterized protein LOC131236694 isoform X2 [Magnolia sinica]|uniref:uncharacterized protein LOC131236694 isoform X2 n=1 Tax=Magnolia sinica TaxID=86752 RepID=UPI00265B21EC|nr:uncharacterized protein LOC131236694 isoform X2 [Magnolia sinica]